MTPRCSRPWLRMPGTPPSTRPSTPCWTSPKGWLWAGKSDSRWSFVVSWMAPGNWLMGPSVPSHRKRKLRALYARDPHPDKILPLRHHRRTRTEHKIDLIQTAETRSQSRELNRLADGIDEHFHAPRGLRGSIHRRDRSIVHARFG